MKKVIEYRGKKLEIIAIERHDLPEPYYDFWVREILEKKHWWNFSRWEIIHENTFWWKETDNFEEKIMELIEEYYNKKEHELNFENSVKNFFEKG